DVTSLPSGPTTTTVLYGRSGGPISNMPATTNVSWLRAASPTALTTGASPGWAAPAGSVSGSPKSCINPSGSITRSGLCSDACPINEFANLVLADLSTPASAWIITTRTPSVCQGLADADSGA